MACLSSPSKAGLEDEPGLLERRCWTGPVRHTSWVDWLWPSYGVAVDLAAMCVHLRSAVPSPDRLLLRNKT